MSKHANPRLVGIFVLGAAGLMVLAILGLSNGRIFTDVKEFVLFFEGRVGGLRPGAPITFRGAPIGSVREVNPLFIVNRQEFIIEVIVDVRIGSIEEIGDPIPDYEQDEQIEQLIEKGLRARLFLQSMVTGQLGVELDFLPDTAAVVTGLRAGRIELPTVPSTFEKLEAAVRKVTQQVDGVDLAELADEIHETLGAIRKVASSEQWIDLGANANAAIQDVQTLVRNVNGKVEPVASEVEGTAKAARASLVEAEAAFMEAQKTMVQARRTMTRVRQLIETADEVIKPGHPLQFQLVAAVEEVKETARSLRSLSDMLERNPNAIVFGKQGPAPR